MKILKIKILKKQAVINFENEELFLELPLLYKYGLEEGKSISLSEYVKIANENDYLHYYRIAVEKLKNPLTVYEFKTYLENNNANEYIINKLISDFIEKKYLDDLSIALDYLEMKGNKKSFLEIEEKLKSRGLSEKVIQAVRNNYNEEIQINISIDDYLKKKRSVPKNKLKIDLKRYLFQKGFSEHIIEEKVDNKVRHIYIDEPNIIQKDFKKIYNKYKDKPEEELIQLVKTNLYKKGYNKRSIEEVLSENMGNK